MRASSDSSDEGDDDCEIELPDEEVEPGRGGRQPMGGGGAYRCLFCADQSARDADDLIGRHVIAEHGVSLAAFMAESGLTQQADWVQLVAFLRRQPAGPPPRRSLDEFLAQRLRHRHQEEADGEGDGDGGGDGSGTTGANLTVDTSLDDPLMYEVDLEELLQQLADSPDATSSDKDQYKEQQYKDRRRIHELEEQAAALRSQMVGMSALLRRLAGSDAAAASADEDAGPSSPTLPRTVAELSEGDDDYYVASYSGASIHAEMLRDRVRTGAYHSFVADNPSLFAGRLVLDVGCGSGILSMFAARSGARVLAVDCASVLDEAVIAAGDNGLADKISFHRGKLEQLESLRGASVDVIISEWMGYFLLYEGMAESVMYARDHCLAAGGRVYPRVCSLHLCGIESAELYASHVTYFDDVYGVRLTYLKERALSEAHVMYDLQPDWVATDAALLRSFDMATARPQDARFQARVRLTASRDCVLHALAGYFDADFLGPEDSGSSNGINSNVTFSTGPLSPVTHWGQTVFLLRCPIRLGRGEAAEFTVTLGQPDGNPRGLSISIQGHHGGDTACCNFLMQ